MNYREQKHDNPTWDYSQGFLVTGWEGLNPCLSRMVGEPEVRKKLRKRFHEALAFPLAKLITGYLMIIQFVNYFS